jgi:hypothetical protein
MLAMMDVKAVVEVCTVLVAAATFVYTFLDANNREKQKEIADWQRFIVYEIIKGGTVAWEDIRNKYVNEAERHQGIEKRWPNLSTYSVSWHFASAAWLETGE